MTATDELRRLLDERGIEHMDFNMPERSLTLFAGDEHDGAYTENSVDTILTVYGASPAQAVEATLGRGTCMVVRKPVSYSDDWKESLEAAGVVEVYTPTCSECGAYIEPPSEFTAGWNYCPNCGRRIEVDA